MRIDPDGAPTVFFQQCKILVIALPRALELCNLADFVLSESESHGLEVCSYQLGPAMMHRARMIATLPKPKIKSACDTCIKKLMTAPALSGKWSSSCSHASIS